MKLFHGSNTRIETIDLSKCKPFKDFGRGFFLTEIEAQALLMAKRTAKIFGGEPIVSVFEFDCSALEAEDISVKQFKEPDEEWALFVMANRNRTTKHTRHQYDIVIGPVADDTISTLFRNYDDGIIDLPTLVNKLKYSRVSSQYFFRTQSAIHYLRHL